MLLPAMITPQNKIRQFAGEQGTVRCVGCCKRLWGEHLSLRHLSTYFSPAVPRPPGAEFLLPRLGHRTSLNLCWVLVCEFHMPDFPHLNFLVRNPSFHPDISDSPLGSSALLALHPRSSAQTDAMLDKTSRRMGQGPCLYVS